MKFSLAVVSGLIGAISAASSALPEAFTLVAEGGKTVLTDGQNIYIGGNSTNQEILVLRSGEYNSVSFTSKNGVPTAFQNMYILEQEVAPVSFSVPHSGSVPKGASTSGFGVNEEGYFTHDGNAYFAVDGYGSNPVKEVYWYGRHSSTYKAANLWVKECKGC